MLMVSIEPYAKQQKIHMTPPNGTRLVCPSFFPVDVKITSEVPKPSLVVIDNDLVEALRVELVRCKLNN
jgi:hypothetical protein